MIICICGKSGSGKSTISNELKKVYGDNLLHIEIDKVGHDALSEKSVKEELVKCFGEKILDNNDVDRKKLGDIVFNCRYEMKKLSDITWKFMESSIDEIIKNNKDKIIVLDYILLPITKYFYIADIKVLLDVDYEIRKNRCMVRDNITLDKFDLREKASIEYDKSKFDIVLKNNDINEIRKLVKLL